MKYQKRWVCTRVCTRVCTNLGFELKVKKSMITIRICPPQLTRMHACVNVAIAPLILEIGAVTKDVAR